MAKFSIDKKDIPRRGKSLLLGDETEKTDDKGHLSDAERSDGQTVSLSEGQTVKKTAKYNNNPNYKKTTYYIRRDLEKALQLMSLEQGKDLTELVNQAIEKLVNKTA